MTDMLIRQVQDNRFLRMGGQLETTLGATLAASVSELMSGRKFAREMVIARAGGTAFTEEQRMARREEEESRWRENDRLQSELLNITDPVREQEIIDRIQELQKEGDLQLEALTRESIDAGRMQTPDALTEQYGDLGLTFDRPMATKEAELLAQGRREEIIRKAIIQAGPQGLVPTILRFGAGLVATAVDPLELASMFIPVVGPGKRAWLTAKLGRVGGRATVGAVEGLVGATITEPFYYGLSRSQQLDYTMADALTNIGLGAVLGGGIGAGIGFFSRADVDAPRLDADLTRQSADVALRQFALGQSVNITRFLDGTDLRSTTTISRVGGIEFQAQRVVDLPATTIDTRPTILAQGTDGKVRMFDTLQRAEVHAEKVGGEVLTRGDAFVVRQPLEGDLVRDPFGRPLTFNTERTAQKFKDAARNLPENTQVAPVNIGGQRRWAVTRDMSPQDVAALERGFDTATVPDGINTREPAVLPDADARIDEAVRGTFAEARVAKEVAQDAESIASDPLADPGASQQADTINRDAPEVTTTAKDVDPFMEQIKELVEAVDDITAEERALLDAAADELETAQVYSDASKVAANCVLR